MVHKNVLRYVIEEIIKLFLDIAEGKKNTDETEKEYQESYFENASSKVNVKLYSRAAGILQKQRMRYFKKFGRILAALVKRNIYQSQVIWLSRM